MKNCTLYQINDGCSSRGFYEASDWHEYIRNNQYDGPARGVTVDRKNPQDTFDKLVAAGAFNVVDGPCKTSA